VKRNLEKYYIYEVKHLSNLTQNLHSVKLLMK